MTCNTCQSKFSFFTREHGCPTCGFSYCSKCLRHIYQLSDGTVKKVCFPCYKKQMSNSSGSSKHSSLNESLPFNDESKTSMAPVDIEHKIKALDNPVRPPIVIYQQGHWDEFKTGLDPIDHALVDRLKKLKDEDKRPSPPTTEDIRRRLALLKDQDPDRITSSSIHHVDTRSDQEKSEDLIRQYLESLELSSTNDTVKDMEKKLNELKGIEPSQSSIIPDDDSDEELMTKKIINKAIAEAALEAKYDDDELEAMEVEATKEYSDEDSTCVMCEQTKNLVQCTGCTGDLYCTICFDDNHDELEMKKHKAIPFKNRRKVPYQ